MLILIALARITLLQQGPKLGPQVTAKGMKMGNACWVKSINVFMRILIALVRITLLQQRPELGPQATAKRMEMENVCWVNNFINDFYINFDRTCQDHTFPTMIQVATTSDSKRNENGKCLLGRKT